MLTVKSLDNNSNKDDTRVALSSTMKHILVFYYDEKNQISAKRAERKVEQNNDNEILSFDIKLSNGTSKITKRFHRIRYQPNDIEIFLEKGNGFARYLAEEVVLLKKYVLLKHQNRIEIRSIEDGCFVKDIFKAAGEIDIYKLNDEKIAVVNSTNYISIYDFSILRIHAGFQFSNDFKLGALSFLKNGNLVIGLSQKRYSSSDIFVNNDVIRIYDTEKRIEVKRFGWYAVRIMSVLPSENIAVHPDRLGYPIRIFTSDGRLVSCFYSKCVSDEIYLPLLVESCKDYENSNKKSLARVFGQGKRYNHSLFFKLPLDLHKKIIGFVHDESNSAMRIPSEYFHKPNLKS